MCRARIVTAMKIDEAECNVRTVRTCTVDTVMRAILMKYSIVSDRYLVCIRYTTIHELNAAT